MGADVRSSCSQGDFLTLVVHCAHFAVVQIRPDEMSLLVTEPLFNPPSLQARFFFSFCLTIRLFTRGAKQNELEQVVFEKHGFTAYSRSAGITLAPCGFVKEVGSCSVFYTIVMHVVTCSP